MLAGVHGAIFFKGASTSVKGGAQSAPFAMGKFALRGLAQARARELPPKGIHVAPFVVDGGVANAERARPAAPARRDELLNPTDIGYNSTAIPKQPRSAWSLEVALRPRLDRQLVWYPIDLVLSCDQP